jgi:prophage regulatory protein
LDKVIMMNIEGTPALHSFPSSSERKRLMRIRQVTETTGLSKSAIYRNIATLGFPRPVRIAPRSVAWVEAEVQDWIEHLSRNGKQAS